MIFFGFFFVFALILSVAIEIRYNFTSIEYISSSGVPQGFNLGPSMFLLFINDTVHLFTCYSNINFIHDCFVFQIYFRLKNDENHCLLSKP